MNIRFVSIILEPSRVWPDYGVVDLHRNVVVCKCSDGKHADEIAACLNLQYRQQEAKQLTQLKDNS